MKLSFFVVALGLTTAPIAFAQTPEHLVEVERARVVGIDLYEHDQAAWHGTDAMLDDIRDPRTEGLSGWITERTPDGIQVLFLKPEGDSVTAVYRALYRDGAIRERGRINRPLSETETRINRARLLATQAQLPQQCAQTYNSVVLPRGTPGADGVDVDVYLMPAQSTLTEAPFGGHFRYAVDTAAAAIRETARFTTGCMTIQFERNTAALMISQVIGETPTEIHVFESLTVGKPVFVTSRSGLWAIEGRSIRHVSDAAAN